LFLNSRFPAATVGADRFFLLDCAFKGLHDSQYSHPSGQHLPFGGVLYHGIIFAKDVDFTARLCYNINELML
jgi:hypothetical protein